MRGREKGVVERSHDRAAATSVFTFISTHQERPRSVWHVVRRIEANRCDDLKSAGSQVFQTFRKILKSNTTYQGEGGKVAETALYLGKCRED